MSLGIEPKWDAEGFPVCSPGLRKLLTEGESAFQASRLISINATLRQEAADLQGVFHEACFPTDAPSLFDLLEAEGITLSLRDHLPKPEDRAVYWNGYRELLTFPLESVRQGFIAWRNGACDTKGVTWGNSFPNPAQIVKLAQPHRAKLAQMRYRVEKALEQSPVAPRQTTPEEKAEVAAGFRALAESFRMRELPPEMKPRLSPQEVAARLRAQADEGPRDEIEVVL